MARGFFNVPKAVNEPVKEYALGSPERAEVLATYKEMFHSNMDVPMHINGEEVRTGNTKNIRYRVGSSDFEWQSRYYNRLF